MQNPFINSEWSTKNYGLFSGCFRRLRMQAHKIKIPKPLKDTYSIAGIVRDLQLQQQRFTKVLRQTKTESQTGPDLLQKKIDSLKTKLLKAISKNPVSVSKKKTMPLLPDKYPLRYFKEFIQSKQDSVRAIISKKKLTDTDIHAIRKSLKDLFYNLQLYNGTEYKKLSKAIYKEKNEKYYKQLLNELGMFQDKCIAIALLKTSGIRQQAGISKQWIKEKNAWKQLLVKKLKTTILPQITAGPITM